MDNHVHKWEWNKYYECALQCTECKRIIGQKDILALIEAAQQSVQPTVLCTCRKDILGTHIGSDNNCPAHGSHSG